MYYMSLCEVEGLLMLLIKLLGRTFLKIVRFKLVVSFKRLNIWVVI